MLNSVFLWLNNHLAIQYPQAFQNYVQLLPYSTAETTNDA